MYFKTLSPKVFLCGNMQMLQIFNEFAWLVHVGILDGVKKKSDSRCLLNNNK